MKNRFTSFRALALTAASAAALPVMASPYASITAAVDFADVVTGVIAVAALVAAVLVSIRGIRWILAAVKR